MRHALRITSVCERRTPDESEVFGRTSFGQEVTAASQFFTNFHALDETMAIYYKDGWVRTTAGVGDVAVGDAATVERSEIDTLSILEPAISGHPEFSYTFDMWIPTLHYSPGGGCQIVLAQNVVTSYGPPYQILWHPAGSIRIRNLITGSFQHTVLLAAPVKGRWVNWRILSRITKGATGYITVWVDGTQRYSISGVQTVGDAANDASKSYAKAGVYRTDVDTDASRGLASVWFRNMVFRQLS
jgi:hypothetical protein